MTTFSAVTYTKPTKNGYCGYSTTSNRAHEYCGCDVTEQNYQTICKQYCDNDIVCKGYDHWLPAHGGSPRCRMFTTSSCSNGCSKGSLGREGNLVSKPYNTWSGCYIKLGNLLYSFF